MILPPYTRYTIITCNEKKGKRKDLSINNNKAFRAFTSLHFPGMQDL